jgi:hypothetical protein
MTDKSQASDCPKCGAHYPSPGQTTCPVCVVPCEPCTPHNSTEEAIVTRIKDPWSPPAGQTIGTAGPLKIEGLAEMAQLLPDSRWYAFPVHVRKTTNGTAEVYVDGRLRPSDDMPEPEGIKVPVMEIKKP